MKTLQLKQKAVQRVLKGNPLLINEDFVEPLNEKEGTLVKLSDQNNRFVATAYLATQNKGNGWVLTLNPNEVITENFYARLFLQAAEVREALKADDTTTAYRFFNGEGDGLGGLTIDVYEEYYVFSWYSEGIFEHQQAIYRAFQQAVPEAKGIYQKFRYKRPDGLLSEFVSGQEAPEPLIIQENGIHYATYLDDGLMTGIFLDQRHVRNSLMEKYSVGRRVLNTFSYTGAFSVAAALGGAVETVSVDLAKRSLPKTEEQFTVNGLSLENHKIRVMDVFDYFKYAVRKKLVFDTIVVDPPSFARSKKRTFSVAKNYTALLEDIIDITSDGGTIIASTNSAAVSTKRFESFINEAFKNKESRYRILEKHTLPEDFKVNPHFKEGNYLKVYIIQKG
ncbi:class I SAM-dependent rRNA methyltransferase [Desemzia sp. FAM 24101]|uniref:class I SAM-dependent rRNA methyltransferase n=1 Tax=unclassified Desemzia TaxID=2685243 RepID=UPI0038844142